MTGASRVGIVVIGRNEGQRLVASLRSVKALGMPVVYVDSGSSDGSPQAAAALADEVVRLDPSRDFSAARARNEGLEALVRLSPELELVQFLDGDCTIASGWIDAASRALREDPKRAVVVGHLSELNPDASPYNRLCAIEWRSLPGDLTNFGALGGIMMARRSALDAVGGFNDQVIAGEDSELGVRLSLAGYSITKIDAAMATHDANMLSFGQWWLRAVRAGHAIGQRYTLNGKSSRQDCRREFRSTLFWGLFLPATILLLLVPTRGLSLLLLGGYALLTLRIYRNRRASGADPHEAALFTRFTMIGKFANALGLVRFFRNYAEGRYRIIEYK